MGRYTYPHTIDNGGGERITFARSVAGASGERLEGDNVVEPGAGPPMHVHHHLDEVFRVEEGRIGYQRRGESPQFAGPGETIAFKAGEAHRFWNAGDVTLRCAASMEPADNAEYILTEIFASSKRRGGAGPNLFDFAFLARRYRSEYAASDVPALVQRFVFPVIVAIGTLLGRYERYADAREPRRSE
jgi:mannose-6-phosphate isomerase-like protein (cupin superfamily)